MRRNLALVILALGAAWALSPAAAAAAGGAAEGPAGGAAHGLDPLVLVGVAVILVVAKVGGEVFERFGQPAVLGELVGGILVGAL